MQLLFVVVTIGVHAVLESFQNFNLIPKLQLTLLVQQPEPPAQAAETARAISRQRI